MQYEWLVNKNSTSINIRLAIYTCGDGKIFVKICLRANLLQCMFVPRLIWLFPAKVCNWYCASTGQLISETAVELNIYRDTERVWKLCLTTRWHEDVFSVYIYIYICRSCDRSLVSFMVQFNKPNHRSCFFFFCKANDGATLTSIQPDRSQIYLSLLWKSVHTCLDRSQFALRKCSLV